MRIDLVFLKAHLVTQLVDSVKFIGPVCHAWPKRVEPPSGEAQ